MIDILYKYNEKLCNNSRLLEKTKINSAGRFLLRTMANKILPIWLEVSRKKRVEDVESVPVVVSLTSFPKRIGNMWIVTEAMLRQNPRPERIILWLSKDQFPRGVVDLPDKLAAQQERGLEIRFVDGDIRSHKKYYYAFNEYRDKCVLTIDDDLLFPSTFVGDVYQCAINHPDSVIANFGSRIYWDESINYIGYTDTKIASGETGNGLFFGSGGGTLFRPARLAPYMEDISVILRLCPTADDIYLNAISRLSGQQVTFMRVAPLLSITNKGDEKLTDLNGNLYDAESRNAAQLRQLVEHIKTKWGVNPFDR